MHETDFLFRLCRLGGKMKSMKRLLEEEQAQGLVEYILIIAVIALVAVVVVKSFGAKIASWFEKAGNKLDTEMDLK